MALLRFALASAAAALLTAGALAGCTSSDGSSGGVTPPPDDGGPTVTCQGDPRVDTYVANFTKASASGQMKVTLVSSDPAPPEKGTNTWKVKITDGGGNPVSNAPLAVSTFMPDHGHTSSVKPSAVAGPDGTYDLSNLYFFMPGVWRVTIANGAESVEFFFCVAG
jgi:hypothetical protein